MVRKTQPIKQDRATYTNYKPHKAFICLIITIAWSLLFDYVQNPGSSTQQLQQTYYRWWKQLKYNTFITNTFTKPKQSQFGIVLLAYARSEGKCVQYLKEAHALCHRLLLKNVNQSYHLNISLFTMQEYYTKYMDTYSSFDCVFDNVIFLEQLPLWRITNDPTKNKKEWNTRIRLLLHSPYYLTMAIDTDLYPCHSFNFVNLYSQMEANDVDFAYTHQYAHIHRKRTQFKQPQGGLFLYRKNNKTNYLFEEWHAYHTENNMTDDQQSLRQTLNKLQPLHMLNVYMLNNRYNFRRFGPRIATGMTQLLYPNNKIILFHRRCYSDLREKISPDEVCEILNKYPNRLSIPYVNQSTRKLFNCFDDSEPKCIDYLNLTLEQMNLYKYVFSDKYHCQWNESVDLVPYEQDKC